MFLGRVIQTRHPVIAFLRNNFLFRTANFFPAFNRFFEATANRKRPMDEGFFGANNKKLAGHLSIQPAVTTPEKSTVALDELFGNGFAMLVRAGVLNKDNPVLKRLLNILPIQIIEFDKNVTPTSVADSSGKLGKWFEKHNADFMLIRPDRYVYDAGKIADLDSVLANFSRLFAR
jgi:3-(3-hydroxy-phenyl)propionate hydroxylase